MAIGAGATRALANFYLVLSCIEGKYHKLLQVVSNVFIPIRTSFTITSLTHTNTHSLTYSGAEHEAKASLGSRPGPEDGI